MKLWGFIGTTKQDRSTMAARWNPAASYPATPRFHITGALLQ